MSEPEKLYTLPEAVKAVRDHAEALGHAAEALRVTEGNDPTILALLGERTGEAEAELWAIENTALADEGLSQAWDQHSALWSVPIVSLAIQALVMGHDTERGTGWMYCQYHAEQIAKNLMAWVTEHEKDAEPATDTKENGTGARSVSQPEERDPAEFSSQLDDLRANADGEVQELERRVQVAAQRYDDARRVCRCLPGLIQSTLLDKVVEACGPLIAGTEKEEVTQ